MTLSEERSMRCGDDGLGTGRRALWCAKAFADARGRVVLSTRHVGRARRIAESLGRKGITPGSYGDAIAAPLMLPVMLSHDRILATLEPLRDARAGRISIDVTNRSDADDSAFLRYRRSVRFSTSGGRAWTYPSTMGCISTSISSVTMARPSEHEG